MHKHEEAIAAFRQGDAQKAIDLLEELVKTAATSELWNDWATIQSSCGKIGEAETGFARALELDPQNHQAKANLGLLLIGLGEHARAILLLEESSPLLPESEREILRTVLVAARERASAGSETHPKRNLSILLIHDFLPSDHGREAEPRPIQIARMLQELGHRTTLIVRDGRHCDRFRPRLEKLGVQVFADDAERLASLGREVAAGDWSLRQLLAEHNFCLALLTQNFEHGISIPEHYLDEIRRCSPQTRIGILCDNLRGRDATNRFAASGEFRHYEIAENWSQREWEALQRADLAIAPSGGEAEVLRGADSALEIGIVPPLPNPDSLSSGELAQVIERALQLTPKSAARHPFSINVVESIYASLLREASGEKRVYARLDFYVQLAEQALRQGQPQFAREQLRHVFGWLGDSIKFAPALAQPLGLLARSYCQLGDAGRSARCAEEARRCFSGLSTSGQLEAPVPIKQGKDHPLLSLIVPTYNRLPILKKCLSALEAQSVPPALFEVIVIDDGSTDGTEAAMLGYRPPFHLQYLLQPNSGTGAARRNGVQHARGEYLLLMNDDTICDSNLLQEHLKAQETYSSQRWAVLGNFEYPVEARRRALTYFLRDRSFMFPQADMTDGCPYPYSHFITCNLSIRREAVVRAGSFDSTYKLSEDTELGIRLFEMGYGVIYHSAAHAWHDHLPYAVPNLIRRARVYGADYFYMFRNHPRVMREWAMPFQLESMGERDAMQIREYLERNRSDVQAAVEAMERWDSVDFEPMLSNPQETAHVVSLFQQAVPAVHWFHLFESMLETMGKELNLPEHASRVRAQGAHSA